MGTYRFILAALVAISHGLITWWGYNPGVVAVISFFVISGYAMAGKVGAHYANPDLVGAFYLDRLIRLFPQYLFYLAVAAMLFSAGWIYSTDFLGEMDTARALLNIPILPLGIPRDFGFDMSRSAFIPQAWSLALELTFYAAVPFLMLANRWQLRAICAVSCLVSFFGLLKVIPNTTYSYNLLPGTLFIFVLGVLLKTGRDNPLLLALLAYSVVMALVTHAAQIGGISREVMIGIIIAVPAVWALTRYPIEHKFDRLLANLSYGVFLNHMIFIWLYRGQARIGEQAVLTSMDMTVVLTLSVAASWVSYIFIEQRIDIWRRLARAKRDLRATAAA